MTPTPDDNGTANGDSIRLTRNHITAGMDPDARMTPTHDGKKN